jgi:hypothetical protein
MVMWVSRSKVNSGFVGLHLAVEKAPCTLNGSTRKAVLYDILKF